ncbi:PREDICTED: LIM and calponin homology domains-containing protein 1 [Nanorana parkeri]|uniref:LIM and calponin homology domains-containing protein 1 n=1 Tax=Nanorana parkeri TaxID=125878 RepID=UPI0008550081|nr:PREDICTED: LIM and calponin homology domains-containing protein 1 [Nanorana parkeri]
MASPALDLDESTPTHESPPEAACREAQKWIEQVTGRSFGDKDFRTGLENGILLCELLNAIKPGLIKKINRLPTPIAGLDNVTLFLRGCKELGLKESQLFDPGDLQDTSNRTTVRISDCNRKLRNVLVTVYWLGKATNSCASYSGNHLDLKEFEGLLAQMRKETEEVESPKRSIRDSGYIDCWDSERSDSLSPPRHGRDDSFDSLDSFGSRSQQTPSPDVVLRGSSDGRGSDSESDQPHRRLPDVRKDDMSARRVSFGDNKATVPFNQYLPNKSNQTSYLPAPLRKKRVEHDYRKSWSTATSPLGGERPFSHPETIEEEHGEGQNGEHGASSLISVKGQLGITEKLKGYFDQQEDDVKDQPSGNEDEEARKLKSLQKVGIKVMPATKRYNSPKQFAEDHETVGIVLRKENSHPANEDSEEEEECKMPDIERDDLATRRARMNQPKVSTPFNQYIGSYITKTKPSSDSSATTASFKHTMDKSKKEHQDQPAEKMTILKENFAQRPIDNESDQEEEEKVPDIQKDDLAKRKTHGSVKQQKEPLVFSKGSITRADLATWQRLKLSSEESEQTPSNGQTPKIDASRAANDDFGRRKLSLQEKRARNKQKFVHFGPVTEIDQKRWDKLCISKPSVSEANISDENASDIAYAKAVISDSAPTVQTVDTVPVTHLQCQLRCTAEVSKIPDVSPDNDCEHGGPLPDSQRDDMLARRIGTFQKCVKVGHPSSSTDDNQQNIHNENVKTPKAKLKENKQSLEDDDQLLSKDILPEVTVDMKSNLNDKPETHAVQLNSEEDVCKEDTSLQNDRATPDPEKDDMMVRRISVSQRPPGVTLTHFLPVPFSLQKTEEKSHIFQPKEKKPISSLHVTTITPNNTPQAHTAVRSDSPSKTLQQSTEEEPTELRDDLMCQPACNPIENNPICAELKSQPPQESLESPDREVSRFSTRSSLSDDAESVSMCDMRYEEEGSMLPHSRAHHEHLQFVNDLLKEEDDTWQDDLARWKTRRRSASQDLLQKEAERKKMERLLSGEPDLSERRKSIKTYKEIVEEKEQREKELHEAYKGARTKEEAEKILQKYIERFTISEAVLERLVMPKILERSHSVEPGLLASSEDPNPLKYLRQESLPSPKFTSTVEATISPTSESDFKAPLGPTSPTKSVVSKAVPMLTPKPYSQPRNTQHVLKAFKVDGKVSMNGEAMNGTEEHKEMGSSATHQMFVPSLTRSQMFEGVARVDVQAVVVEPDASSIELSLKKPNVQNSVKHKEILPEERNHNDVVDGRDSSFHTGPSAEGTKQHKENPIVTSLEFTPSLAPPQTVVNGKDQEEEQKIDPKSLSLNFNVKEERETALHQVKTTQEHEQEALRKEQHGGTESSGSSAVLIPALNSPSRFCSWDPDEERRRQERWQQEQERLLQERYQKEQEKLKDEWEKAQKEVEEEERKYYEEEKKIIEDTLMPVTVSPATSLHRGVCEMNGSMTSNHREQQTTSEETWTEAKSCVKEAAQPEDIKPQVSLWTLEGAVNRPEEQQKGSSRLETEETVPMTDKENNYTFHQQCSTLTSLHLQFGVTSESHVSEDAASLNNFEDSKNSQPRSPCVDSKGLDPPETPRDTSYSSQSSTQCQSPSRYKRSVSGKKLCSTCGLPLGKGAAMIIETLSLYFHIQCFKCGVCKGQLGDATTGTDVRIRNGLLNCNDCYVRSRTAGHPTPL